MLRSKRKYSLVDRFVTRNLIGSEISDDIFSDWCEKSHSLFKRDLLAHYGCVNAVEFSDDGTIFVSGSLMNFTKLRHIEFFLTIFLFR